MCSEGISSLDMYLNILSQELEVEYHILIWKLWYYCAGVSNDNVTADSCIKDVIKIITALAFYSTFSKDRFRKH